MRVALNGYFWSQPRTGSGQYLRHLWSALQEFALPSGDSHKPLDLAMLLPARALLDDPVPTGPAASVAIAPPDTVSSRSANLGKLLWEEWGIVKEARKCRADLLHSPYLSAPLVSRHYEESAAILLAQESERIGRSSNFIDYTPSRYIPLIVTAHDMIPWVVPGYNGSLAFRLYLLFAALGVKRAAAIMADSEASRQDVIRFLNLRPEKVHTVYLGTEPTRAYTDADLDEVRARYDLPRRYAFYLGGFDRRKNVPLLLRAWRDALPSLDQPGGGPLLAIGGAVPEPGGIFPDVRGEAESLGLSGSEAPLRFLGRISESDKPLLMAAAHLFIYPSAYEGFGLDPLEAMSVGCPVVSSSGGSLAEVVGEGGLLVPPGDHATLTQAIIRAWNDPELRADLSARGKIQSARFTWERTARQTLDIYSSVLNKYVRT